MSKLRIHPAIGFARVGNSQDYYLAPETPTGLTVDAASGLVGGLPIKAGTEAEPIRSSDLRDASGALKRQGARFRIFSYADTAAANYPSGQGAEIRIGSVIDGKTVKDIVWTVHLANKKANCYVLEIAGTQDQIIDHYAGGALPPPRNPLEGWNLHDPSRIRRLTVDAGPRAVTGAGAAPVAFDRTTTPSHGQGATVAALPDYPVHFPANSFPELYCPTGPIDTLGEMLTDASGRLIVLGGYGRAIAWNDPSTGQPFPLTEDVDNDGWFDDTADGPVSATVVFTDSSTLAADPAWVVSTDPGYAPQILNVVSLWDDMYDTFVRKLNLRPDIYRDGAYQSSYKPSFADEVHPIFRAAALQQWNTNLPRGAQEAHKAVDDITADDDPRRTIMAGLAYVRNPNNAAESNAGVPLMPLSLGDSGKAFLSPSLTQYFFLSQWDAGVATKTTGKPLGAGEQLDKAALMACLGGRFSPGIDMTFVIRQPELYKEWTEAGPFRLAARPLDYAKATKDVPFLGVGYVPLHTPPNSVEPGDMCKFMALPWHTDYNSCATHTSSPNPFNSTTLYWSWPAQRPVAVYVAEDVRNGQLGPQQWSVRGVGTESLDPAQQGRYQARIDMITNWPNIGVVMQGSQIDGGPFAADQYLEAAGQLESEVKPWPINALPADV